VHNYALGFYNCLTCGEEINMGFMEIVDPVGSLSVVVPYYNEHFMAHGSFSTDREGLYPRVDPRDVAAVLGLIPTGLPDTPPARFAFWNAPNPFRAAGATEIVLALPAAVEELEVAIFDCAGRRVRGLREGAAAEGIVRIGWDGRDEAGREAAAGVYFCRARLGEMTVSRKITLVP
ncbi:MAG: FlgD immunoglobulin-like domain containing protein, partial [Candidatus Eisenbacteria bacterium]